jgi:hypothetical protein
MFHILLLAMVLQRSTHKTSTVSTGCEYAISTHTTYYIPPGESEYIDHHMRVCRETSPGKYELVIDAALDAKQAADLKASQDKEKRRQELWLALETRLMTDEEVKEAQAYGEELNTPIITWVTSGGMSYTDSGTYNSTYALQKEELFLKAWYYQNMLQAVHRGEVKVLEIPK